MKSIDFKVGEWYYCSCNTNYYRFLRTTSEAKVIFDAQINPIKGEKVAGVVYGFTEVITEDFYLEYFKPDKIVPKELIDKHIKQIEYEIY